MDERYRLFAGHGARNIVEYNRKFARGKERKPLPYLVLVIDELADLMMTAAEDIERQVCRLAQMARATGIHLVLATQRPSVDVITGLIKANFPSRIAFAVTSQIDSRVILDTPGAEKLLGRGDMLYMAPDSAKLQRIQGCLRLGSGDRCPHRVLARGCAACDGRRPGSRSCGPIAARAVGRLPQRPGQGHDELMGQALKLLANKRYISTSVLQRQLRIGFPRAARLMDQLEEEGYVGGGEGGGRSREVLYQGDNGQATDEEAFM
jgi:DNA segregation ATPase FtsK/SpoIIIE, S-DNA-T family